jgi:S-formylglutathione hydrolase FrmB
MYSYITKELPETLFKEFKELDGSRVSITGHSMGGHGALTLVGAVKRGSSMGTNKRYSF